MPQPSLRPGGFPQPLAIPVALALVGALLPWLIWAWFRFPAIGGADPGLWEAAALRVSRGDPSPVAAAYPILITGLVRLLGVGWDQAGLAIAAACFAALGPVTWLLARNLGVSPALAGIAGLLALGEPWLALGALQAQPDTLSALAFLLAVLAALAWVQRPGWPRLIPLLLAIALVPQVREHAPVISAGLLVLLAVAPGGVADRVERLVFALILLFFVPTLLGETMVLPWQQAWVRYRWGEIFRDFASHRAPSFLDGTPRAYAEAFRAAYADHDHLRIAWLHTSLNVHHGWTPWAWMGLGFVGWLLAGRRRWVLMIGLLPLLAVPGGAQQPRHVAVLVPLAAACMVAGLRHAGRWRLWVAAAVGLVLVTLAWARPGRAVEDHRGRCEHRVMLRDEALLVRALAGSDAVLISGNPRYLIYCDLETADVATAARIAAPLVWVGDLPRERPQDWPSFEAEGFAEVPTGSPKLILYLRPAKGTSRP
ncbi:MAG: hypothetical protein ABIO70_03205 [Pseudomonadota bacterium]